MSEEQIEEPEEVQPKEEDGVFYVSQINPIEAEEEMKLEARETVEGDEETAEDIEDETYTYQKGPLIPVRPREVQDIVQRILEKHLKGKSYNAAEMTKAVSKISSNLRDSIKKLNLDRYRIISHVTIGEKCDQDVLMNFLYLWKHDFDHYAVATYEEVSFFATALVFLVYKQ